MCWDAADQSFDMRGTGYSSSGAANNVVSECSVTHSKWPRAVEQNDANQIETKSSHVFDRKTAKCIKSVRSPLFTCLGPKKEHIG